MPIRGATVTLWPISPQTNKVVGQVFNLPGHRELSVNSSGTGIQIGLLSGQVETLPHTDGDKPCTASSRLSWVSSSASRCCRLRNCERKIGRSGADRIAMAFAKKFADSNEFHVRKNDPRNLSSANVESFVFLRRLVGVILTWDSFLCPHSFAVIPKSVLRGCAFLSSESCLGIGKGMRAKE